MAGTSDRLSQVFAGSPHEAEVIRGVLESSGIATVIEHPGTSAAYRLTVGPLGQTIVSVAGDQLDEANELLGHVGPVTPEGDGSPSQRRRVIWWAALFVLLVVAATALSSVREWLTL